jgi:hypothetical protein
LNRVPNFTCAHHKAHKICPSLVNNSTKPKTKMSAGELS